MAGSFGGRQLHCQPPAEHGCITWVNKGLGWDVVFNWGVAPQQKNADTTGCVSTTMAMGADHLDPVESVVTELWTVTRNPFVTHRFVLREKPVGKEESISGITRLSSLISPARHLNFQ